jgi:hypothetical protein
MSKNFKRPACRTLSICSMNNSGCIITQTPNGDGYGLMLYGIAT